MRRTTVVALAIIAALAAAQERPPLFEGMGPHKFKVTTTSPEAQDYFNQGLVLCYGFNLDEAHRAYMYAAALDPNCAMAWWGAAYTLGPNLNERMSSRQVPEARALAERALRELDDETEVEKALVNALQVRYADGVDRNQQDRNYAEAMREVVKQFPENSEVLTLAAEAMMDVHTWNYWTREKAPQEWTPEIADLLDRSFAINPDNPGTCHFMIHLWEASKTPEHAEKAADRLASLAPGVEHLVHMPAHIFYRIGRYHDGMATNVKATQAYDEYVRACSDYGLGPIGGYEMHNWEFVWAGANFVGDKATAHRAAEKFAGRSRNDTKKMYTHVRYGEWDEIMRVRPSDEFSTNKRAVILYARAIAQAHLGDTGAAQAEYAAFIDLVGQAPRSTTQRIMKYMALGEIAFANRDFDRAVEYLGDAKKEEDSMTRGELAGWHHPVRLVLGKVLLAAGRAADAETEYREQLKIDPELGWALLGLVQAFEAQEKAAEAAEARARFEKAWKHSDVKLTSSSF